MRSLATLVLIGLCAGCSDLDISRVQWDLKAKNDGAGLPDYLDKQETVVTVEARYSQLCESLKDSLLILGCQTIRQVGQDFRGDRKFVPGFVCGVGGETLLVSIDSLSPHKHRVRVVSYKRHPYPAAPRFLDGACCDILLQLLQDRRHDEDAM